MPVLAEEQMGTFRGKYEIFSFDSLRCGRMETRCNNGQTALIAAARQQSWMVVRRLAEARANLDAVESSDAKQSPKHVIVRLAETSQWDTLIHLARHGANLEARGQAGRTVLMYAAECGLDDVAWLAWLLQCLSPRRRADPNAEDERGETALLKACNRQLEGFMRVLWEGGAGIEIPVQKSRIPAMSRLLQKWNGDEDEYTTAKNAFASCMMPCRKASGFMSTQFSCHSLLALKGSCIVMTCEEFAIHCAQATSL
eukprot:s236_g21.t1